MEGNYVTGQREILFNLDCPIITPHSTNFPLETKLPAPPLILRLLLCPDPSPDGGLASTPRTCDSSVSKRQPITSLLSKSCCETQTCDCDVTVGGVLHGPVTLAYGDLDAPTTRA